MNWYRAEKIVIGFVGLIGLGLVCMLGILMYECGHRMCRGPVEGRVESKESQPATQMMIMMPVFIGKLMMMRPHFFYCPPSWSIQVKKEDGSLETVYLSQETWETIKTGDHFSEKNSQCWLERPKEEISKAQYDQGLETPK